MASALDPMGQNRGEVVVPYIARSTAICGGNGALVAMLSTMTPNRLFSTVVPNPLPSGEIPLPGSVRSADPMGTVTRLFGGSS